MTLITTENVAKLYLATFGRPLDSLGLEYYTNTGKYAVDGTNITTIENLSINFAVSDEYATLYPSGTSNSDFITAIYNNLFDRDPDADGLAYWVDMLNGTNESGFNSALGTVSKSEMVLAIMNGATDDEDGNDASLIQNRADVALDLAQNSDLTEEMAKKQSVIDAIKDIDGDMDAAEVDAAKTAVEDAIDEVVASNNAPIIADTTASDKVENTEIAADTVVATAAATDADSDTITYSITAGNEAGLFAIDEKTGAITVATAFTPDFETTPSYSLTVGANDGIGETVTKELTVLNIDNLVASYDLAADAATAKDGDTVTFTFTTTNVEESELTEVMYTISGVDAADVVGGKLTGSIAELNLAANATVTLNATQIAAITEVTGTATNVQAALDTANAAGVADRAAVEGATSITLTDTASVAAI